MRIPQPIQRTRDRLPTPPTPDAGEIESVDLDASTHVRSAPTRPCHQCDAELDITEDDYVEVRVRLFEPSPIHSGDTSLHLPKFCSRACYAKWAGQATFRE